MTVLAHEFFLRVSDLELHSNGTKPATFFGALSSLEEAQFLFEGAQAVNRGARPGMPPPPVAPGLHLPSSDAIAVFFI